MCESRSKLPQEQIRALVETFPAALLLARAEGVVTLANRAARRLLGVPGGGRFDLTTAGRVGEALRQALDDLAAAPRVREHHVRVVVPLQGAWRVVAFRTAADHFALLVQAEGLRDHDLCQALIEARGLTASEARIAVRVYRGLALGAVAQGFGLPEHALRQRLSRLYRRLHLRGRAGLVGAVSEVVAELQGAPSPAVADGAGARRRPPGATTHCTAVDRLELAPDDWPPFGAFLHQMDIGLAAVSPRGEILCCNREARRLLRAGASVVRPPAAILRALRVLGAQADESPDPERAPVNLRIEDRGEVLHAMLWPAAPGLLGLQVRRERVRAKDLEAALRERFGLSFRQACLAALVGRGHATAEAARASGLAEGSVHACCAVIYAKLGVRDRAGLTAFLDELARCL